jgi:hypothetical protein
MEIVAVNILLIFSYKSIDSVIQQAGQEPPAE